MMVRPEKWPANISLKDTWRKPHVSVLLHIHMNITHPCVPYHLLRNQTAIRSPPMKLLSRFCLKQTHPNVGCAKT